jgi:CO dehydrogenase/acetyl-CoA synthase alpha subunit
VCLIKKQKKYQYLYLQKKIDFIEMEDRFDTENTLLNDQIGMVTELSNEKDYKEWEENGIKIICKIKKYRKWLGKINRKYNYA